MHDELEWEEVAPSSYPTIKINRNMRTFVIDFDKVKTVEDVIEVIKMLNINLFVTDESNITTYKKLIDSGLLIEKH